MPHITIARTGRTYYDIDSQTASLFVEAGLAEYFTPAAQVVSKPRPTVPTFSVVLNNIRNKYDLVLHLPNGSEMRFSGAPALAKNAFKNLAWSASAQAQVLQGPEPSEAVLKEYASAYTVPQAEHAANEKAKQKALNDRAEAEDRALRAAAAAQQ